MLRRMPWEGVGDEGGARGEKGSEKGERDSEVHDGWDFLFWDRDARSWDENAALHFTECTAPRPRWL